MKSIQNKLLFTGKIGQITIVNSVVKDLEIKYLIIVGAGDETKLTTSCIEELGAKFLSCSTCRKVTKNKRVFPSDNAVFKACI